MMKIIFEDTNLPENKSFRENLLDLLKIYGYGSFWSSAKTLELIEPDRHYQSPRRKPKVQMLRLDNKIIIANGVDPLMYVDLSKRELHKYEDEDKE